MPAHRAAAQAPSVRRSGYKFRQYPLPSRPSPHSSSLRVSREKALSSSNSQYWLSHPNPEASALQMGASLLRNHFVQQGFRGSDEKDRAVLLVLDVPSNGA